MTLTEGRRRRMDPLEPFVEGCTGKFGYATKATAKVIIRRRRAGGFVGELRAYRCRACGWIHLTTHPKREL